MKREVCEGLCLRGGLFVLGWRNTLHFGKLFQLYSPTEPKKGCMLEVNNSLELWKKWVLLFNSIWSAVIKNKF